MRRGLFLILLFAFFILPSFALAYIAISGTITSNTTWSPAGGVYVLDGSFSVATGITLTIEPGTIIKVKVMGYYWPSIYGKIIAHGTSTAPIYFTSINDDSVGGDTNNDGPSVGERAQWQGLYFKPGSEGIFDYVNISYAGMGGYGNGDYVGIENDGGILNIQNSNIHDNYTIGSNGAGGSMSFGAGIYNKSGTLSVSDSVIDNDVWGIRVDSGTTTISNNIIKNNVDSTGYGPGYGVYAAGSEPLTLINNTFSGNRRTAYVDASKNFTHSGNTSEDRINRGFEMNGIISEDTTFTSGDLPFIIGSLTINTGGTLTLEPGTILKMNDYYSSGNIVVHGNLIAKGTKDNKIYITSLRDDFVGGDTNGNGDATIPAPKNWQGIFFENSATGSLSNTIIKYGGYGGNWTAVYNRGAELSFTDSFVGHNYVSGLFQDNGTTTISKTEFTDQPYGIQSRGGTLTLYQNNFHGNTSYAIYNQTDFGNFWYPTRPIQTIDARQNFWGDSSGPKDTSTSTPTGTGDAINNDILYKPFLTENPLVEKRIDPVIIIPGIMGSAKKNGQLLIDPILHTYDDLIATLKANGYEDGKNLFTFPYEWRDSNIQTANLLKNKINQVKQTCLALNDPSTNCSKVDLVAHSMGGLVAREYIQSGQYQNDVDQVIFLGTPHKGSPKAYLQWEGGEFPAGGTTDKLIKLFFQAQAYQNRYSSIFDYIRNRPILSVQELLPTFDYLKDNETGIVRTYPNNYPRNTFLEYLNNDVSKLLNSGVRITNIIGNSGNNTIEKIRVVAGSDPLWVNGKPDGFDGDTLDRGLERGSGDETVTIFGSTLDGSIKNEEWDTSHNNLPRETSARIFNLLTNKIAANIVYSSPYERIFSIQLHSPIDMLVTAPDGKRMGKNFATGEEYNEIPGAFYSGFNNGDEEHITIPNPLDGEYKIELQGTGDGGEFGVVTNYINDESSVSKEYLDTIKPGEIKETYVITGGTDNSLSLEISVKKDATQILTSTSNVRPSSSSGGSRRQITGEVLGASTITDNQRELQLKLIEYLKKLISLYMLLLNK